MEQYNVTGMSCAACSARVEKAVKKVPGVTSCSVSLLTNSMGVEGTASSAAIRRSRSSAAAARVKVIISRRLICPPSRSNCSTCSTSTAVLPAPAAAQTIRLCPRSAMASRCCSVHFGMVISSPDVQDIAHCHYNTKKRLS